MAVLSVAAVEEAAAALVLAAPGMNRFRTTSHQALRVISCRDAVFGFRAAGAALLSNLSYEKDKIVHWNPEEMKLV